MPGTPNSENRGWVRDAVGRFEASLTLYASKLLRNPETARDVVQETFLRLCEQDRNAVDGHLAEWLFTVCRNRSMDILRKENRMTQLSGERVQRCLSPEPGPLDLTERRDMAAKVLQLMDHLPPNQREVIRLKFQNGFSYLEISRITGLSVSNVGFLLHAGIKTLRGLMFNGQPAGPIL